MIGYRTRDFERMVALVHRHDCEDKADIESAAPLLDPERIGP